MRVFWGAKRAGQPLPRFTADEVLNFKIGDALAFRAAQEEADAAKKQESAQWKAGATEIPDLGVS